MGRLTSPCGTGSDRVAIAGCVVTSDELVAREVYRRTALGAVRCPPLLATQDSGDTPANSTAYSFRAGRRVRAVSATFGGVKWVCTYRGLIDGCPFCTMSVMSVLHKPSPLVG